MDIYKLYDEAVSKTLQVLIEESYPYEGFQLENFDAQNLEHMYILSIMRITGELTDKDTYTNAKPLDALYLKWLLRGYDTSIKWHAPKEMRGHLLDLDMNELVKDLKDTYEECRLVNFGDIYKEYYDLSKIRKGKNE